MYAFLNRVEPNRLVSMHQPLDGVDTTDGGATDTTFRNALAHNLNLPLKAFTCYSVCHGSMTGWLTRYTSTTAITVEFTQTVSSAYLSGPAARGIVSALMVNVHVPPAPSVSTVAGIARATGATAGGNTVTITGSGFTGAWRVAFGTVLGTSIKVLSATKMTVVAPKHPAGAVDLVVTGPGGASAVTGNDRYTYVTAPAINAVAGIAKASGSTNGGNTVTITGTGFTGITSVLFASEPGTSIKVLSPTTLAVVAPKHPAGLVDVLVRGTYGPSLAVSADHYTFVAPPSVTSVTSVTSVGGTAKAAGSSTGGNIVTLTGAGFTGITAVRFGSVPGRLVKVLSPRTLTVTAPAHAVGQVHITLTGTYGASIPGAADVYSYLDLTPPAPVGGLTIGGTGTHYVILSWTNPPDADFNAVMIRRAPGATAPATSADGTLVADVAGSGHGYIDGGLNGATTYSYALFAHDVAKNLARPTTITVITRPNGATVTPMAASPADRPRPSVPGR
jgi:hypothetical protein